MKYLRNFFKSMLRIVLRIRAQGTLSRLRSGDEVSRLIGDAIQESMQNDIAVDEKKWIDQIELFRKELIYSSAKISFMDYGAGGSSLDLTDKEMDKGRIITRTVGDICISASKPYFWSLLLFKLIRKFKPSSCLELGTCLGVSAFFQSAALKLNGKGKLITLEGAESLASLAEEHFQVLDLDNVKVVVGRFQDTLSTVLETYKPIDYAFIDGHHDEKATLLYFEQIKPFLSERALLIFDDISWSEGMKKAWKTIEADEMVKISVNLRQIGICVIDHRIDGKQLSSIPMV